MTVVIAVFCAGLLIGGVTGVVAMALCVAAGMETKRNYEEEKDENSD